ncbi:branched-chain amino acid transporter [Bacillus glycinifermentans]|uniref:AzlD domain-containing protein n=1 Tax=Bacillus glycinifermentans TaxID=1664069 RepID=A0A0J6ER43_9BACI|nr:AzlD domain-containing protein [Bacillus glycinifermentans]ATH94963.1 AzlD domain-containing protein [Bacillus glycinifermentans]KMM57933.1 branched-chain amino acid transporter [Bacillus glycinifermentans]KRT93151.1 branched-chain amino acid transporter [Bacillus glycinifermentans]MEC0487676.1 AzlD domain-containing protein [Bacillus glycinifermentans]MEC0495722.1 AzlD domain-containing protein [Bacillus glycinifermentans]
MVSPIVWMILGMAAVTYLPRVIPLVAFESLKLPRFLERVLKNVPYAVLGALIFPGVFLVQSGALYGLAGAVIAFLLSYMGMSVIIVVSGTIAVLAAAGFMLSL